MKIGMLGLGRMGSNMVRRLMRAGQSCAVYDVSPAAVQSLAAEGASGGASEGSTSTGMLRPCSRRALKLLDVDGGVIGGATGWAAA